MATMFGSETATIYQFPVGGRKATRRFGAADSIIELKPQPAIITDYGAWYHDEAIRETEDKPKS
jgi:hypothetical protein